MIEISLLVWSYKSVTKLAGNPYIIYELATYAKFRLNAINGGDGSMLDSKFTIEESSLKEESAMDSDT